MRKKLALGVAVVALLGLVVRLVWAEAFQSAVSMHWDEPGFTKGYVGLEWTSYNPSLFIDVEVRRALDGTVAGSQVVESDCVPTVAADGPGVGECGSQVAWTWETDGFLQEQLEEWVRIRWSAEGFPDVYGVYVPADCTLPDDYCTAAWDEAGETLEIGAMCEALLEACGTRQDDSGFWLEGGFVGTGAEPQPNLRYLPIILKAFSSP